MSVEIELKAWADNEKSLKNKLDRDLNPIGEYLKEDVYWVPGRGFEGFRENFRSGLRVRKETWKRTGGSDREDTKTIVCFKMKEIRDSIEVNDEKEFEVSNPSVFEELIKNLGFEPDFEKTKQGWAWDCG